MQKMVFNQFLAFYHNLCPRTFSNCVILIHTFSYFKTLLNATLFGKYWVFKVPEGFKQGFMTYPINMTYIYILKAA